MCISSENKYNIPQCSGNKQLEIIDVNVMVNLLANGNVQLKDLCQINNKFYIF
jgi:hypothetical protein